MIYNFTYLHIHINDLSSTEIIKMKSSLDRYKTFYDKREKGGGPPKGVFGTDFVFVSTSQHQAPI